MKLNFRKATVEDAALIAELADSIWKEHYISIITMDQIDYMLNKMYSKESIAQQMNEDQGYTLVMDEEQAIGYVSLSTKDKKHYFLHKFYICTNKQTKGIGTEVMEYCLKINPSAESIELTVNRKNYKAINFYFKNGFFINRLEDFDIGNGYFMNDFVMIKKIVNK
ncbi:MAG: GNAT family N-acetyltransferase [Bacteroidia bacterium]